MSKKKQAGSKVSRGRPRGKRRMNILIPRKRDLIELAFLLMFIFALGVAALHVWSVYWRSFC